MKVMPLEVNPRTQKQIGDNLRQARERKNLSQEDAAKAAKISVTYYAGIERGEENPTITVIESICKALRVKSSEILPF